MRTRSRPFVALLALLLLLVTTAEGVWASVCAPEMRGAPSVVAAERPSAPDPGCPMEHTGPQPSHGSPDSPSGAPHCPFLALGGAGSCIPVSLPARSVAWEELVTPREVLLASTEAAPDLLLVSPPFHPPKA